MKKVFNTYNQNMPIVPAGIPAVYTDADYDGNGMGVLNSKEDEK